jgi:hypothetical protein
LTAAFRCLLLSLADWSSRVFLVSTAISCFPFVDSSDFLSLHLSK